MKSWTPRLLCLLALALALGVAACGDDGGDNACTGASCEDTMLPDVVEDDTTVQCLPSETTCGGDCVDTGASAAHCGGCNQACSGTCVAGACCEAAVCGDACVDLETSLEHCGGCDQACAGTCLLGVCCEQTVCDDACVDTSTTTEHCGGCNQACAGTCTDGDCCAGDYCDGICVDFSSSTDHCGGCDNACLGECVDGDCHLTQIFAGALHTCALLPSRSAYCWGEDSNGQCCIGELHVGPFANLSLGRLHSCGVNADSGEISCWGDAQRARTRDGSYVQVVVGDDHTCGLEANGRATCWGQWGVPGTVAETHNGPFQSLAAGSGHTCGLRTNGTVECWGLDDNGQVSGVGTTTFKQLTAGEHFTCGLTTSGGVYCWGDNGRGQFDVPAGVGALTAIEAGANHVCGLRQGGEVACWGDNREAQAAAPTLRAHSVGAGGFHSCAVAVANDSVSCWGRDLEGQVTVPTLP